MNGDFQAWGKSGAYSSNEGDFGQLQVYHYAPFEAVNMVS